MTEERIILIIIVVLATILIGLLVAAFIMCNDSNVATIEQERVNETSMFVVVETTSDWEVVYHKQTKVMYVFLWAKSSFTVLLNADGTPMLWKGE